MLTEKAILVNLSISNWTGFKKDRKVTEEVNNIHNAKDSGNFNKLLIAKKYTEPIQKVVTKARDFHYENTLDWDKNGAKLLPTKNYITYMGEIGKLKFEFEEQVKEFIDSYDEAVLEARVRLGTMFRDSDYPKKAQLWDKFGFQVEPTPVPATDFRVDLGSSEVEKIRKSVEQTINAKFNDAVKDIWTRIKDQLVHMKDKLSDKDAKFKNSLFGNLEELVGLIPRLNVTEDKNINEICEEMRKLIVDADTIRSSNSLRAAKAKEVDNIMNKFSGFFK